MSVDIPQLLGSSFISFMLSYMLMKSWLPFAPKRPGEVQLVVRLGLLQRLLVHRTQAILVLLYILLGSLPVFEESWFLPGTQPAALAGLAVIVMLPLRYVFTDVGVALSNGVPRPYRSFRRFVTRQGRGRLASNTTFVLEGRKQPRGRTPSLILFIPTSEAPAVTRLLKRRLR
ncbi:MAG TPA: hypothetical protein VHS99_09325 [Chloroflexota bacterium]|jgi:hypothetical protein|nr:hypothetical protein [Chloroflexota bacterium]